MTGTFGSRVNLLLRANPSKDGDAELRGFRGVLRCPPGRQRFRQQFVGVGGFRVFASNGVATALIGALVLTYLFKLTRRLAAARTQATLIALLAGLSACTTDGGGVTAPTAAIPHDELLGRRIKRSNRNQHGERQHRKNYSRCRLNGH